MGVGAGENVSGILPVAELTNSGYFNKERVQKSLFAKDNRHNKILNILPWCRLCILLLLFSYWFLKCVLQMTSSNIHNPHLEQEQIIGVIESLKKSPKIHSITITSPAAFIGLPHHSSLRYVNLRDIPRECGNWNWLENNRDLKEIYLSISESDELLMIHDKAAEFAGIAEAGTVEGIIKHLSKHIFRQVHVFHIQLRF